MFEYFILSADVIFMFVLIAFFTCTVKNNLGLVDVFWGLGFVLIAWTTMIYNSEFNTVKTILVLMITLWGLRLSGYLARRNWNKPEDFRYASMRKSWGKFIAIHSLFKVFFLQGSLMFLLCFPIILTNYSSNNRFEFLHYLGVSIFLLGFLIETMADFQKSRFKQIPENKERFITTGLWKYSRHPNYFGEAMLWWGVFVFSIPSGFWYINIISPILTTTLVRYVSGVPYLEKNYEKRQGFGAYKKRTSTFIPWFPKQ